MNDISSFSHSVALSLTCSHSLAPSLSLSTYAQTSLTDSLTDSFSSLTHPFTHSLISSPQARCTHSLAFFSDVTASVLEPFRLNLEEAVQLLEAGLNLMCCEATFTCMPSTKNRTRLLECCKPSNLPRRHLQDFKKRRFISPSHSTVSCRVVLGGDASDFAFKGCFEVQA